MEMTGPTGVVDVPKKLFPNTAAVSSGIDGIDADSIVRPGDCQLFPLVYAVLRPEAELAVEPEFGAKDETSVLDESCSFLSGCRATGCLPLLTAVAEASVLPTVLADEWSVWLFAPRNECSITFCSLQIRLQYLSVGGFDRT